VTDVFDHVIGLYTVDRAISTGKSRDIAHIVCCTAGIDIDVDKTSQVALPTAKVEEQGLFGVSQSETSCQMPPNEGG
jgi:hypothetical protein